MRRSQPGRRHRLLQRTEGTSAVEFAIILPILLMIICGIIDFGQLYYRLHTVNAAARAGARLASVQGATLGSGTLTAVSTAVHNFGSNLHVSMTPSTPVSNSNVTVTVTDSVSIITPLIRAFSPSNPYTLTGKSVMQVE
jgi:Flp pilus assembly protein TadG